jgi:hypothetical protein
MTFLSILAFLKRIPSDIWFGLVGIAIVVALWVTVVGYGQSKYTAGYTAALTKAAQIVRVDTVDRVVARTDTIVKRVTKQIATVDTLIEQVHDTVRVQFPEVAKALNACTTLTNDCAALKASVLTERTAWAERDTALRLTIVAKSDTVRTLRKRWTRTQSLGGAALAALLAFFGGR